MAETIEEPVRRIHPGSGRRKGRRTPKGRQVDPQALDEVRAVLGDRPRRRDLLIEHLHLIQDHYGYLGAAHLAALAEEMRLALVEVYEVASFYAHFDIVLDGEEAPPAVTVRICDSLSCEMMGARQLLAELPKTLGTNVRVMRAPCMGGCHNAPVAAIGHALHEHARSRASLRHCTTTKRTRASRLMRTSTPIAMVVSQLAARFSATVSPAGAALRTFCRRWRIRICAASAAPVSQLAGSGASSVPKPARV
jgi:NADH:ubiquinone oxidoreductase subunit E